MHMNLNSFLFTIFFLRFFYELYFTILGHFYFVFGRYLESLKKFNNIKLGFSFESNIINKQTELANNFLPFLNSYFV